MIKHLKPRTKKEINRHKNQEFFRRVNWRNYSLYVFYGVLFVNFVYFAVDHTRFPESYSVVWIIAFLWAFYLLVGTHINYVEEKRRR